RGLPAPAVTFGEIVLARGDRSSSWVMSSVAPHVSIKLKRWFKQLDVAASWLRLSATPALSAELAWFLVRYPMRVMPEYGAERGVPHTADGRGLCRAPPAPGCPSRQAGEDPARAVARL